MEKDNLSMEKDNLSMEKERLLPTTPASETITLALIGAWHNSLAQMPAMILVSPLLDCLLIASVTNQTIVVQSLFHT